MNPLASRNYFDLVRERAALRPDHPAVIDRHAEISYGALADRARRIAGALQASGIARGSKVGALVNNRVEWLELCFGANAVGAVLVPFSTWSTEAEFDYLIRDSGIEILFALDQFGGQDFGAILNRLNAAELCPALREIVMLGASYEAFRASAEPFEGPSLGQPEDDALILYTSGSSARPKAVRLVNRGLVENGFAIGERMGLSPEDRVLVSPPLFWSYGSANALPAILTHGATMVLQGRFEPGEALELIERHRCTALYTLPAMTNALVAHPVFNRSRTASLRTGLTLGTPQDLRIAAGRLGVPRICNIYGATEIYGNCCVTPADWPLERRATCQGPPLPSVRVRIVDPDTRAPRPIGEPGEVEVKGYVTPGYAGASAEHNISAFTADGYFRTGDLAYLDEAGYFHFVGRESEMIKRAGINVSPAEVEDALQRHAAVAAVAVVGAPDSRRGEVIFAFVVPVSGREIDAEALRAHCRSRLSSYKVPDRIEFCDTLPVTKTGKLFKRELKEQARRLAAASEEMR
ncbi:MAG TPA: class I adenylate-forming enzyme family protein [Alphaproteobacteria bacterium]|nr:class I adenylate-forming enzyme family protein [Alphaproteobacteria bacterium]